MRDKGIMELVRGVLSNKFGKREPQEQQELDPREKILRNMEISQTFVSKEFAEMLIGREYTGDSRDFQVKENEEGELILQEWGFCMSGKPKTFVIDVTTVELPELVFHALEAFKRHRAAGNFSSRLNPSTKISGKKMERHLDSNIQFLEKMQQDKAQGEKALGRETVKKDKEEQQELDPRKKILRNMEISQTFVSKEFAEVLIGREYIGDSRNFQVKENEEGELILQEWGFCMSGKPKTFVIDVTTVELPELVFHALEAFKRHRAAGNFSSRLNPSTKISGEEMKRHLDANIQFLEQMQQDNAQGDRCNLGRKVKEESIRRRFDEKEEMIGKINSADDEMRALKKIEEKAIQGRGDVLSKLLDGK